MMILVSKNCISSKQILRLDLAAGGGYKSTRQMLIELALV